MIDTCGVEAPQCPDCGSVYIDNKTVQYFIDMYTHTRTHTRTHTHTHAHALMNTHAHGCAHTEMHTHTYMHIQKHAHTHMHTCMPTHKYTRTHRHIHVHTHRHIHAHTYNLIQGSLSETSGLSVLTSWLRVLTALSEDLGSILSTHMAAHNHL